MTSGAAFLSSYVPAACWPCTVLLFLNGLELTRLFFATCLNELLVRLGPPGLSERSTVSDAASDDGDVLLLLRGERGDVMLSRLWICSGDQPLAEDEMIESRAAREAEGPLPDKLSRADVCEELDGGDKGVDASEEGMVLWVEAESGVSTANGIVLYTI